MRKIIDKNCFLHQFFISIISTYFYTKNKGIKAQKMHLSLYFYANSVDALQSPKHDDDINNFYYYLIIIRFFIY